MCSFLITSKQKTQEEILKANKFQQFRGPDATHITVIQNVTFLHNLLSITGTFTPQPFQQDGIVCIYNGEIYNYKDILPSANSDGECLIKAYKSYGETFLEHLDGEFAIVLWDFNTNKIIFGIDTFGCKPLFYSTQDGFHFASYKSALEDIGIQNIKQVEGNEWFMLDVLTNQLQKYCVHVFDTDNEHKTTFDDWNEAFIKSIQKRAICDKPVMMGVSEGYDSGSICSALVAEHIPFKMYSVNVLTPPSPVLLWRHGIPNKPIPAVESTTIEVPHILHKELIEPTLSDHFSICADLYKKCEPYEYTYYDHSQKTKTTKVCRDTYGFLGAGLILKKARAEGYRVCLSGLAGDIIGCPEINQKIKTLGNLNHVVDYDDNNVYSCEYCCGVHGIEIRYPFLDVNLWQETLWLDKSIYTKWKHPQHQFMVKNRFPFVDINEHGEQIFEKVGFYKKLPDLFIEYRNRLSVN
jgi:asparagine synthetase B (glutamine-hydrolysing)